MKHWIALLLLLFSCTRPSAPKEFKGVAMTIPYRLLVGDALSSEQEVEVERILQQTLAFVHNVFDDWNPDSEVSQLGNLAAGEHRLVSPELEELLEITQQAVELSGGLFDPTIHPLQQAWKKALNENRLLSSEEIQQYAATIGWESLHWKEGEFWKDHEGTQLNLGGIAKGHCVDLVIRHLQEAGYEHLYFEWGGEIRVTGQHPQGRAWTVSIQRLEDPRPEQAVAVLALSEQSIATSGDCFQYWDVVGEDGEPVRYTHIIDPHTYTPLEVHSQSIASSTVVAPTCALADALATAAMLFPDATLAQEWAKKVHKEIPETAFWILTRLEEPSNGDQ